MHMRVINKAVLSNNKEIVVNRNHELQNIIELTRRMAGLAEAGSWEELPGLQTERQNLMNLFFQTSVKPNEAEWVESAIVELLRLEHAIVEKTNAEFQILSTHLTQLRAGKKAVKAYGQGI